MLSSLSIDLRERVVAAIALGASCHGAAARFGVSVSSASSLAGRARQEGQVALRTRGGGRRSQAIKAHAALILSTCQTRPEIVLHDLRDALAVQGVATSTSALIRRWLRRGSFTGVVDLQAAIKRYIAEHNRRARPFDWTKAVTDILAAVSRSPEPSA